jgi:hypothetical protein
MTKFYEYVAQKDFEPIKSFYAKDTLNPSLWDDNLDIDEEIRRSLLKIVFDFLDEMDLDIGIKDIILTGSLANYNWSEKYSDYDVHIISDFSKINKDISLVEKYVDLARKIWNEKNTISIGGFEVELYIQNTTAKLKAGGTYSILRNRWIKKPQKVDYIVDEKQIREKAKPLMMTIDDIDDNLDNLEYRETHDKLKKVWKKIKRYRKEGLDSEGGEFSVGNFVFKLLRRNGYINKFMDLRIKAYKKQYENL